MTHRRRVVGLVVGFAWALWYIWFSRSAGCCRRDHCRIIVAGFTRSGSTWQYNVARLLLQGLKDVGSTHGHPVTDTSNQHMLINFTKSEWVVAKSHHFWPDAAKFADCVFLTHRDARDTVLSWMRMSNSTDNAMLQRYIDFTARYSLEYLAWRRWCKKPFCHEMSYQTLQTNHVEAIHSMQRHLGPSFRQDAHSIHEAVQSLYNSTRVDWDPETAFHTKHVTNGGSQMWKEGNWDEVALTDMDIVFETYHSALGYPLHHGE
jgi:hypothetical protein